ncbi:NAD(+)/NADH kinase [Patescibacteria group bacterium]|nr:NAD(+)/NADH kinase [Patescibacteria group bacterium]
MKQALSFKKDIQKVGLITKSSIGEHKSCLNKLIKFLLEEDKEILVDSHAAKVFPKMKSHSRSEILKESDFVITLGGDGTILKAARAVGRTKTLILGINFGTVGFLTETTPDKMIEILKKIVDGKYNIDRRSLLRTTLYRRNKKIETFLCLNDAVINQGAFARLIEMDLEIDSRKLTTIKADGLIIATPSGSTGHALSAGGPVIHPKIDGLTVTPICPTSLSMRSIVLPDNRQLTVRIGTRRREATAAIGLTLDGQNMIDLQFGDRITFRRSKRFFYMARTGNRYYKMLRQKLGWGA